MFERKDELFNQLHEMSPSWLVKLIFNDLGIEVAEVNELLYNPALTADGEKNDFEKLMHYEPLTEDCATKLGACLGDIWTKKNLLFLDQQWKELIEKKGLPPEAYQDFFLYCFGYKL